MNSTRHVARIGVAGALILALLCAFAAVASAAPTVSPTPVLTDQPVDPPDGTVTDDFQWTKVAFSQASGWGIAVAYDPVRHRIWKFGGYGVAGTSNDLWVLDLAPGSQWTRLDVPGTRPTARMGHVMEYDVVHDRLIVFGGYRYNHLSGDAALLQDVWALPLAGVMQWTPLAPANAPPSPRHAMGSVYLPGLDAMLIFGGQTEAQANINETWLLHLGDPVSFEQLAPLGPLPIGLTNPSLAWDPSRQQVLLFGGGNHDGGWWVYQNQTWSLSLAGVPAWTHLAPIGAVPSQRTAASMIYDPVGDQLVMFGGVWWEMHYNRYNDTWRLPLAGTPQWLPVTTAGEVPDARSGGFMLYDAAESRAIVGMGSGNGASVGDTWALTLGHTIPEWLCLDAASRIGAPAGIWGFSAAYDATRDAMLLFGGRVGDGVYHETWSMALRDEPHIDEVATGTTLPGPRCDAATVYDPVRDRLLVFGGGQGHGYSSWPVYDDVWALGLGGAPREWTQLAPSGTPPPRLLHHTALYDAPRDRVLIYAGDDAGSVWACSLTDPPAWTQLVPASGDIPPARSEWISVLDIAGDRLLVYGGGGGGALEHGDVWAMPLSGEPVWTHIVPVGGPPDTRINATGFYEPARHWMIVFGGQKPDGTYLNDTWGLSLTGTPVWTKISPRGPLPLGRSNMASFFDPVAGRQRFFVLGGSGLDQGWFTLFDDMWELSWGTTAARGGGDGPDQTALATWRIDALRNPARGIARFALHGPRASEVTVGIYALSGARVATLRAMLDATGDGALAWDGVRQDGTPAPAGMYAARLDAPGARAASKILWMR